jgi:type I restriction enzyme S subunit
MLVAEKTSAAISWPLVSFDKVAIAQSDRGQRLKQRDYLAEGSIPVIDQGQALVGGYTDDENASFVGDLPVVLFGDHTRAVKLIHHRFAVGADGIKIFRPAEGVRAKYLYYWMKSARIPDRGYGRHYQYLRALSVPLPPEEHQDEIVAELEKQFSRLDEAVANLQRVKANLKRYKASVLKDAVEGRLVPTEAELARREGRSFETGEQLLQRILDTRRNKWSGKTKFKEPAPPAAAALPPLPDGWAWATMPQLGELNRGKSKHRPRDDAALYGGPYPFIQTGDVRRSDGSITAHGQTYSEFGLKQSRLWPIGTLCITIAANIAETGILKLEACFPDSVVGFVSEHGYPTTEYVEFFIRTARAGLDRFASATAQKNINLEVLESVAVPTPPLAEQQRIVAEVDRRLSLVRGVESEVDANLNRAQALRQATLHKAFAPS